MATLAPRLTPVSQPASWAPRALHPLAWWVWALGLAVAASRTTNPLLLAVILAVTTWVVLARRTDAPWASAFKLYLLAGLLVVSIRVAFRVVFAGNQGSVVLLPLPDVVLPSIVGISLFGDVTAESLLAGLYDGLRLATMLVCLGAANALANPRRLLRCLPPALHEVSTALVVALSVFPQLAESVVRVRRARRLRVSRDDGPLARARAVVIPVLEDALDRSLMLAASMDSRGYGRRGRRSPVLSSVISGLLVAGLAGIAVGAYALLDFSAPSYLQHFLAGGMLVGIAGIGLSGRGVVRSAYRPDRRRVAETLTASSGWVATRLLFTVSRRDPRLHASLTPLEWPQLPPLPVLGLLAALLPAFVHLAALRARSGVTAR